MSSRRLASRVRTATPLGIGSLASWRREFHKPGRLDGSGKCDIVPGDAPNDVVYGVIVELSDQELLRLDAIEGVGLGYEARMVTVRDSAGAMLAARTYVATHTRPGLRPFHWYKHHVLTGAIEHDLPRETISGIRAVRSMEDPDRERAAQEMAIYD